MSSEQVVRRRPGRPRRPDSDYYEAGLRLVAREGPEAMSIRAVCREMGLTHGPFEAHFASLNEFLEKLMLYWASRRYADVFWAALEGVDDPRERLHVALEAGLKVDAAGRALRRWTEITPRVKAEVARGDQETAEFLGALLLDAGCPAGAEVQRAWVCLLAFHGLHRVTPPAELVDIDNLIDWLIAPQ